MNFNDFDNFNLNISNFHIDIWLLLINHYSLLIYFDYLNHFNYDNLNNADDFI